jgi:hypothetical protein
MHNLLESHGIYTQVARSNPLVLRIQPPLTITFDEVCQVLSALEEVCTGFNYSTRMVDAIISKSTLGEHQRTKDARSRALPLSARSEQDCA